MDLGAKTVEIPSTIPGVGYTLRHRICVEALIKYYCKRAIGKYDGNGVLFTEKDYKIMVNRGKCHDMDKLCTGLCYPQLTADYFHRLFNGHHAESIVTDVNCKYNWIEMVFDWESARYTKPDKGKCAYEVATTFNNHLYPYVKPYLELFGFTKINNKKLDCIVKKIPTKVYEEDLMKSILNYIQTTHIHRLEGVSRIDDMAYLGVYGQPTPFRNIITQQGYTLKRQRPNNYVNSSNSLAKRELINGTIEAQVFDFDALCLLNTSNLSAINKSCMNIYKDLQNKGCHR